MKVNIDGLQVKPDVPAVIIGDAAQQEQDET